MTNQAFNFESITDDDLKIASGGRIRLQNLTANPFDRLLPLGDAKPTALAFLGPPEFAGIS